MLVLEEMIMEAADRVVKEAFDRNQTADLMSLLDIKPLTAKYVHQIWQKEWDERILVSNKLHEILPKLSDHLLSLYNTRKENTVLNRLHIGHACLTHIFLLRKEDVPVSVAYTAIISVKHILIECADSLEIRKKYFEEGSLYSLFQNMYLKIIFTSCKRLVCFTKYELCWGNVCVKCFPNAFKESF